MKSERRHELQHNDLAEWLTTAYERVAPYTKSILGVGLLLVVAVIGLVFWRSHSVAQANEAWTNFGVPNFRLYEAPQAIDMLGRVNQTYAGTSAGDWAGLYRADTLLTLGEDNLWRNKDIGTQFISEALKAYATAEASNTWMIRERAMFGGARATESLGNLEEAKAAYEKLNKAFPQGTFKAIADQRLQSLGKEETARFYKSLSAYTPKPKPPAASQGTGGKAAGVGDLLDNPPSSGPLTPALPVKPDEPATGPSLIVPGPLPGADAPKKDGAKAEPPKTEAPKTEAPKGEPAKTEPPKTTSASPAPAKPQATTAPAKDTGK